MKAKAVTLQVPLFERYVTILVAKEPVGLDARNAFIDTYERFDAFMRKCASHDWKVFSEESFEGLDCICIHSGEFGPRFVVWAKEFRTGLLMHELTHVADRILQSTNVGDNTEVRAYLMERLSRETVNGLRRKE